MGYILTLIYDALERSLVLTNPVIIEKLNEVHDEKH
ncbi:UNVERIFIED_CONTAM: hypothetical protein ABIC26_003891 [Paenibacillus sp. PvR008]